LPEDLVARIEERVGIEAEDSELPPAVSPDVAPEPLTQRWVEIREEPGEKLVTVIEFVSPTKTRKGLKSFVKKRKSLLAAGVNVVEVDLTRSGDWHRMLLPQRPPKGATAVYRAVTRVASEPDIAYLEPIDIRKPLPVLRIPLRESEEPIDLPLQALIDQAYRNGRYAQTIDYSKPPVPPLDEEDAAWADSLLRCAGKR